MAAYYRAYASDFIDEPVDTIQGRLSQGEAADGFHSMYTQQILVWTREIGVLKDALGVVRDQLDCAGRWTILLEYPIPRRARRIDAVVLAEDVIVVLEFKDGEDSFERASREQVEDYALDLRDFHQESRGRTIVPILVGPTEPKSQGQCAAFADAHVKDVRVAGPVGLARLLLAVYAEHHQPSAFAIDGVAWNASGYWPVPTIIEAAEWLFRGHDVTQIAHSCADQDALRRTSQAIIDIVNTARGQRHKVLCVVTGVPGAGKTLVGLNAIHNPQIRVDGNPAGTFLSGNGPLVMVLRRALVLDAKRRGANTVRDAEEIVNAWVAGVHTFYKAHAGPKAIQDAYNKVVVFDEAQRAWTRERVYQKTRKAFDASEPQIMLEIMNRHVDWAVIVALVGGGQEIHDGEAGLAEWGRALADSGLRDWHVVASPAALRGGSGLAGSRLFTGAPPVPVVENENLHLAVSVRSLRAEKISDWVDALLSGRSGEARALIPQVDGEFHIRITRDLATAKAWLRASRRGTVERCGLVASASDRRLRAYGIELSSGFTRGYEWDHWYLAPADDVRSSCQLEVAATEFHCQGLELDWVGVCWGSDLARNDDATWDMRRFGGNSWSRIVSPVDRNYLVNTYRVLLTRARKGLIIWVPPGNPGDPTLAPEPPDRTYRYLRDCGITALDEGA